MAEAPQANTLTAYETELDRARNDIAALTVMVRRNGRDPEKRVRLAYRQFHQASLTGSDADFAAVKQTIADAIHDFGPMEDICLLKANLDGRFHCVEEVKHDLQMCPSLARRHAGRAILADVDFQEGRYEQARLALESLINEKRTWDNLARLAHWKGRTGHLDEADRLYEEAEDELTAKELRSFSWLELQRGALAMSHGRYGNARAHYQRAAASFSGHWHTDQYFAGLLAAEGNRNEAVAVMRTVVARASKPELKQVLADLLMSIGRTEEAHLWRGEAVAAFLASAQQRGVHYYHHLAEVYADMDGYTAEAVKWARKDVALRSNFSTQSALARALLKNGEEAEGLAWIRLALTSGVKDSGIFTTAAALFHAAGDTFQGERYAHAATEINPTRHHFHPHH